MSYALLRLYIIVHLTAQSAEGFLIHNTFHNKCISIENEILTIKSCATKSTNQMWRWTQNEQLQSVFNQSCLSAPDAPKKWDRVKLSTCDPYDRRQVWTCTNKFLRLKGTSLNINYGNTRGGNNVVLHEGTGSWSEWNLYRTKDVCAKQKDAVPPTVTSLTATPDRKMLGKTVVITCEAIPVPVSSYTIIHNNTVVVSTKKTYIITVFDIAHAGSYKCIAKNTFGNNTKTISLSAVGSVQKTIANSSNEKKSGIIVVSHVVVSLLSGFIIGVLLSCIVGYSRRRYRNKKKPAASNAEPQASSKTDSMYQDLDINKMYEEENYESLSAVISGSDAPAGKGNESDYTELNIDKVEEDNYQSLTST